MISFDSSKEALRQIHKTREKGERKKKERKKKNRRRANKKRKRKKKKKSMAFVKRTIRS